MALGAAAPGAAGVFMSQAEALAWAFPDADHVDRKSFALSDEQLAKVGRSPGRSSTLDW